MKIYLSTDMEGTAGIVDWQQCVGDGPDAAAGRELLLATRWWRRIRPASC
ncbi:M55 family metallopeptidase [Actinoplanes sp. TBRC 11911]|nr:M55 family metallopeptidase [Actinoplanes sp. TBRC 11911]NMO49910.1 M55 family metallopeptidase [Actinoplanes sp. TBRC 11911]